MTETATDAALIRRWFRDRAHPHVSGLRWYGSVGYAFHRGVRVDMHEPPAIAGQDIEFLPGVCTRIDGREMTEDEITGAYRMLEQMATDARDALHGTSTLTVVFDRAALPIDNNSNPRAA